MVKSFNRLEDEIDIDKVIEWLFSNNDTDGAWESIKTKTAKVNNTEVAVVNCKGTEVCSINIERSVTDLTYAILNTSNYNGGMGATIVKCFTPIALEEYGFENAECIGISLLKVGEVYTSTDYGNGVVVVRMS
jgi:hypothetical protein